VSGHENKVAGGETKDLVNVRSSRETKKEGHLSEFSSAILLAHGLARATHCMHVSFPSRRAEFLQGGQWIFVMWWCPD